MSKIFRFLILFLPYFMLLLGSVMLTIAWQRLEESVQSLECFCPSCQQVTSATVDEIGMIRVDIQGAVMKPGLYELKIGQRLADIVDLAGGFSDKADRDYVIKTLNLSKELKNQDKIYIPFFEENQASADVTGETTVPASSENTGTSGESGLISINQASATQLQTLSGVGEVKSKAIIDNRPYTSLEELVSKKVFSENLLNNLREQISL